MKVHKYILILTIFPLVVFSKPSNDEIYTLYRNSVLDESMRLHVATFDAENGKEHGEEKRKHHEPGEERAKD